VLGLLGHPVLHNENHGWASPYGFMVWVVTAMASGQDIATRAPPVPMPRVVWVFLHAQVILNLHTASQKGGSFSDCPSLSMLLAAFQPFFQPFQQHFLYGDFRIAPSFVFSHPLPTTIPYCNFWENHEMLGWVGIFLFLFFSC